MSDFYDSLEDEGDEKCSSDSLNLDDEDVLKPVNRIFGKRPADSNLTQKRNRNRRRSFPKVEDCRTATVCQEKNFLPQIENCHRKGSKTPSKVFHVDNEALNRQGLQLNEDGSFTKTPRDELEQLPFVTREYRNLQFQKRKTYEVGKRSALVKKNRKNIFTFKESSGNQISMLQLIRAREKKNSSEEILTSGTSTLTETKVNKDLVDSDNLTDSMKEMLLQKQNGKSLGVAEHSTERLAERRKIKEKVTPRVVAVQGQELEQKLKECANSECLAQLTNKKPRQCPKLIPKLQELKMKASKNQSGESLAWAKPRLSYLERHQKESGFNPLSLRYGTKRIQSDTSRPNFGDSAVDKLSEVSSRIYSRRGETDEEEEEEAFYRKIMEKGKNQKMAARHFPGPEEPFEMTTINNLVLSNSSNSHSGGRKLRCNERINSKHKHIQKSVSSDMPTEVSLSPQPPTWKKSHYCSTHASPSLSKNELALKARAYGYMANARNIFRLRTQSEGKLTVKAEGKQAGNEDLKGKRDPKGEITHSRMVKPTAEPKEKEAGPKQASLRSSKSFYQENPEIRMERRMSFVLPHLNCAEKKQNEFRSEILKRIKSCLNGPDCKRGNFAQKNLQLVYGTMRAVQKRSAKALD